MHYFLGLEVSYTPRGIVLTEKKFTFVLLDSIGISHLPDACTPLPLHWKLDREASALIEYSHWQVEFPY